MRRCRVEGGSLFPQRRMPSPHFHPRSDGCTRVAGQKCCLPQRMEDEGKRHDRASVKRDRVASPFAASHVTWSWSASSSVPPALVLLCSFGDDIQSRGDLPAQRTKSISDRSDRRTRWLDHL